jgi:hypothetical protein
VPERSIVTRLARGPELEAQKAKAGNNPNREIPKKPGLGRLALRASGHGGVGLGLGLGSGATVFEREDAQGSTMIIEGHLLEEKPRLPCC